MPRNYRREAADSCRQCQASDRKEFHPYRDAALNLLRVQERAERARGDDGKLKLVELCRRAPNECAYCPRQKPMIAEMLFPPNL